MTEQQIYAAKLDELDALAHDCALEILYHYPKDDPFAVLRNIQKFPNVVSYVVYLETYEGCKWSNIKKYLLRKIYKWLKVIIEKNWQY
jgi:hypothetical protein